ncbi:MAG: Hsp70 family protein, partial [archaeon]
IDANGIVHVTAKDKGTGIETSIKIVASQKLNDEEIERMKKEAEAHADEDKKVKEDIEVFNTADATAYSTEKMLVELKDKLSDAQKKSITEKLDDLKAELAKEDRKASVVNSKVEDLNKALQAIGSEVYGKMQQDGAASGAGASNNNADEGNSNGEDKVVDAEFEDKSKDKKK